MVVREMDHRGFEAPTFAEKRVALLRSLDAAHEAYYRSEIFDGPSFCFHAKSLNAARDGDLQRFAECSYAMLVSWGMHRMGRGGPKMLEFEKFEAALTQVWPTAMDLNGRQPDDLSVTDWDALEAIFRGLRCMATGTSLVAHSKVMAHLIPELVAPVDREYTLTFLFGRKDIDNRIDREWQMLKGALQGFFYPIRRESAFEEHATAWLADRERFRWDTSRLKIVDNLIIGLVTISRNAKKAAGGVG